MATAGAAAAKELRWQLLKLFPEAPMKLLMEAAKTGNFDRAMDVIRAGTAAATPGEQPSSEPAPAPEEPATASPEPDASRELTTREAATPKHEEASVLAGDAGLEHESRHDHDHATDTLEEDMRDSSGTKDDMPPKVRRTVDGWEIKFEVDLLRPCQSLRTRRSLSGGVVQTVLKECGTDNTAAFASVCFEQMLRQEQELEKEFCVFYHSYNAAALIYEVQAEIARYAFGMEDKFAPLPRIFQQHFIGVTIDDLRNSEGAKHADSLPSFRKLAICASPTIFAFGSEAPPLRCFRHGYGIPAPLRDLTRDLLCEVVGASKKRPPESVHTCMGQLTRLATKFGLVAYDACGAAGPNRLGGQMLQIFIRREEVDHMVYNSLPFGVPIPTDSVHRWLAGDDPQHDVDGQVRILMRPEVFLDASRGRIFHYAGDWEFHGGSPDMEGSRAAFVQQLRKILQPLLSAVSTPAELRKRLTGETDAERAKRGQTETAAMRREFRSAISRHDGAAAAKTSESSGYPTGKSSKKKGKKH
eukprot:TRINITY_DN60905_c0_g1_i1.p1 TRINITY_DN60905_c0_g1~~TRINITY_DN60905_c0_g1_i1.p1  ORF type:complete len:542 (-),score=112.58 TRINITY_DN60905_c0_g1_i1:68-1651(-)